MKRVAWCLILAVLVTSGCGKRAEENFRAQETANWKRILTAVNNFDIRLKDRKEMVNYAGFHKKSIQDIEFTVEEAQATKAELFRERVQKPMLELLVSIINKPTAGNKDNLIRQADIVDNDLDQYASDQKLARPTVKIGPLFRDKLASILQSETALPATSPRVVYLTNGSYPTYVVNAEQRTAFDTARRIARAYFSERHRLQGRINWSHGKIGNWSYFQNPSVRSTLDNAISVRRNLLSDLQAVESVEGMTNLSLAIKQMLNNSIESLSALYVNQDYGRFKAINNRNDQIQVSVTRSLGI